MELPGLLGKKYPWSAQPGAAAKKQGVKAAIPRPINAAVVFIPPHPVILSFFPLASRASAGFRISPRIPYPVFRLLFLRFPTKTTTLNSVFPL